MNKTSTKIALLCMYLTCAVTGGCFAAYINEYAAYEWDVDDGDEFYIGIEATSDVYGFNLQPGQISGSQFWIYNIVWGEKTGIQVGWHVYPELYKDSQTHFFTHWMRGESHCYNTICSPGFQIANDAIISPGDVLSPVSGITGDKHYLTVRVIKDTTSGDWNVYCRFNDGDMAYVGYFPRSVIPDIAEKSANISFGGFIGYQNTQQPPPMGSGYVPFENAASFTNLQLIDGSGKSHSLSKDLQHNMQGHCYKISHIFSSEFYYGGPNNCT